MHPDEDENKTTASVTYSLLLANDGWFNAIVLWGMNKVKDNNGENAFLAEGSWRKRNLAVYGKYEYVQKSVEEKSLNETIYGRDAVFTVNVFTLGLSYDLLKIGKARLADGSQYTIYHADSKLNSLYGKNPMALRYI